MLAPPRAAGVRGNESNPFRWRTLHHMAHREIFLKREVQEAIRSTARVIAR
jgi:hypothetical protein